MTIKIFGYRIEVNRMQKCNNLSINKDAAQKQAQEIKNSETFKSIKAQAQAYRAQRTAR